MDINRILQATAAELAAAYRAGLLTPTEATLAVLEAAEIAAAEYSAIAVFNTEDALAAAAAADRRFAEGTPIGPLDGIPVSVKDSFPVVGLKRWHGSALNDHLPPSAHDGAPVKRLREAGAVIFAKAAMPDFGRLSSGVSSQFGVTRNPWNPDLNTSGSSSGSAALVASGVGPLSVGTDTGGSVRLPAALCGLAGMKPTHGRIAYDPPKMVGTAGPMARTVADMAQLLSVIGQADPADHLSLPGGFAWDGVIPDDLTGLRIGLLMDPGNGTTVLPEVAAVVDRAAEVLAARGATIVPMEPIATDRQSLQAVYDTLAVRGAPELVAAPRETWEKLPGTILTDLLAAMDLTAMEHVTNEKGLEAIRKAMTERILAFDYVLSPMVPFVSFPAEALDPVVDGVQYESVSFTFAYNITSLPAGNVTFGIAENGMPIGVQIGSRRFNDEGIVGLLALLEQEREVTLDFPFIRVPAHVG